MKSALEKNPGFIPFGRNLKFKAKSNILFPPLTCAVDADSSVLCPGTSTQQRSILPSLSIRVRVAGVLSTPWDHPTLAHWARFLVLGQPRVDAFSMVNWAR